MSRVFDVVVQAGSLPIDELKLRAGETNVDDDVERLESQGWIEVRQETLPESSDIIDVVSLTRKGFKVAVR